MEPVLILKTAPPVAHHININGSPYALRGLDDLPLAASIRMPATSARIGALLIRLDEADLAEAEATELDELLRWFVRAVLVAPATILDALTAVHCMRIAEAYTAVTIPKEPSAMRAPRASFASVANRRRRKKKT